MGGRFEIWEEEQGNMGGGVGFTFSTSLPTAPQTSTLLNSSSSSSFLPQFSLVLFLVLVLILLLCLIVLFLMVLQLKNKDICWYWYWYWFLPLSLLLRKHPPSSILHCHPLFCLFQINRLEYHLLLPTSYRFAIEIVIGIQGVQQGIGGTGHRDWYLI